MQDRTLLDQIRTRFTQHHERYGSSRFHDALRDYIRDYVTVGTRHADHHLQQFGV